MNKRRGKKGRTNKYSYPNEMKICITPESKEPRAAEVLAEVREIWDENCRKKPQIATVISGPITETRMVAALHIFSSLPGQVYVHVFTIFSFFLHPIFILYANCWLTNRGSNGYAGHWSCNSQFGERSKNVLFMRWRALFMRKYKVLLMYGSSRISTNKSTQSLKSQRS